MATCMLLAILGGLFFLMYVLNQKTPVPIEVQKESQCHHCHQTTCAHYKGESSWEKL